MTNAHQIGALAVAAATAGMLAVATWSVTAGRRSGGRHDHRFAVDRMVLIVEGLIAANAALGAGLLASALRPTDVLHLLYGPAALLTLPVGWALGARRRAEGTRSRLRRDAWLLGRERGPPGPRGPSVHDRLIRGSPSGRQVAGRRTRAVEVTLRTSRDGGLGSGFRPHAGVPRPSRASQIRARLGR